MYMYVYRNIYTYVFSQMNICFWSKCVIISLYFLLLVQSAMENFQFSCSILNPQSQYFWKWQKVPGYSWIRYIKPMFIFYAWGRVCQVHWRHYLHWSGWWWFPLILPSHNMLNCCVGFCAEVGTSIIIKPVLLGISLYGKIWSNGIG